MIISPRVVAASFSIVCALACSSSTGGGDGNGIDASVAPVCPTGVTVSFSADVQPILTARCAGPGCHDASGGTVALDLREGSAHADLVGVDAFQCADRTLVTAGDLEQSYLVNKLTGIDMCSGTLMPGPGLALSDAEMETVLAWICGGAADD